MLFVLLGLIVVSALFSGSETALMSLNRYRLRHYAERGNKAAKIAIKMLEHPDRILGVILIGNTLANVAAASIATIIAVKYFGTHSVWWATIILTLVLLVFSELMPKTIAANYPEKISLKVVWVLRFLLQVLYPLVWLISSFVRALLRIVNIKVKSRALESVSIEEIQTLVSASGDRLSKTYRSLLQRVFSMEKATVADIMVPRQDIIGIDLEASLPDVLKQLRQIKRDHAPVYFESIDDLRGVLHLRDFWAASLSGEVTRDDILKLVKAPYFIPETAYISQQFAEFKRVAKRIGFVVDEYGDIQGMVSVRDIISEVMGGLEGEKGEQNTVWPQSDGSCIIDGAMTIRDLNRIQGWELPKSGPKTVSGLVVESLEAIPSGKICLYLGVHKVEVLSVEENTLTRLRVWPPTE